MAIINTGSSAVGTANVDAGNNLQVALSNTHEYIGGIRTHAENNPGDTGAGLWLRPVEVTQDYRLRVGIDSTDFLDSFNYSSQDTGRWKHSFATMTMTQSSGFLNINAAGTSTASGNYAYLQSWQYFALIDTSPIVVQFIGQISQTFTTNEVFQAGLGVCTGAAEPVDGVWYELTNAGLYGCMRYNSGTTTKQLLVGVSATPNVNSKFAIVIGKRQVNFWVDDVLGGTMEIPNAQGQPFLSNALPVFVQKYNAGVVTGPNTAIIKISNVNVLLQDLASNKPWATQMATSGAMAYQGQSGGTLGSLATVVNSTNPTTALPVNTALTANLPGGLGGIGLATLWNLASTDMILNSYQNPLGGVNQTPRNLIIHGITITGCAATAAWTAPAAGTHALAFYLAFGHTAVSLATADTASFANNTTKSPRRVPIGIATCTTAAAPIGTPLTSLSLQLEAPITVNPGEFIAVVCRMLNGAAVATGGLYYTISYDGYFE